MEKFLLFTTGGGSSDPLNWDSSEAVLYNAKDLESIKPATARSLDLTFNTSSGTEIVTLKIKNGLHNKIISSIATAIGAGKSSIIAVADIDGGRYINNGICGVTIKTSTPILYYQKITTAVAVEIIDINTKLKRLISMTLANVHSADATVQVYLLDGSGTLYYIIKDVVIPVGTTLKLESDELDYDASVFNLYVKLGGSTPVDVIVR